MENSSHKTQVIVALLGLLGVIVTTVFSNWDKLFTPTPKQEAKSSAPLEQPQRLEKTASLREQVLLQEAIEDNSNGWAIAENGTSYNSYFEEGKYVMETKNEGTSSEMIAVKFQKPENFALEVTTIWRQGVKDARYGLVLGVGRDTYYTFGVNGNGNAVVGIIKEGKAIMPEPMAWKPGSARVGEGFSYNRIRIEGKGEKISYYVNDQHIGDILNSIIRDQWAVGVMVQGKQKVAFDDLVLTAK
ncbi:MAG TPA: hypothetical protein VFZ34_02325 [Blastocatellia bacterium]|nr:hypothetical protein [Blastocatellia bacterium]